MLVLELLAHTAKNVSDTMYGIKKRKTYKKKIYPKYRMW